MISSSLPLFLLFIFFTSLHINSMKKKKKFQQQTFRFVHITVFHHLIDRLSFFFILFLLNVILHSFIRFTLICFVCAKQRSSLLSSIIRKANHSFILYFSLSFKVNVRPSLDTFMKRVFLFLLFYHFFLKI